MGGGAVRQWVRWPGLSRVIPVVFSAGLLLVAALSLTHPVKALAALPAGCVQAGLTVTCTYASTGVEQTFDVPAGIASVQVTATGASGAPSYGGAVGGQGAQVSGSLTALSAGQTLYVEVGGAPTNSAGCYSLAFCTGGFNGGGSSRYGGGGGGSSDVRTEASSDAGSLATRLIVAAGGGGGGEPGVPPCDSTFSGEPGGDAGAAGGTSNCAGVGTSTGGGAGTQAAGGAAGTPSGGAGALLQGGGGNDGGGGGGGGLYGGGGGGDLIFGETPPFSNTAAGGGGGGSSLIPVGGTGSLTTAAPSVAISYTVPSATPTISTTPTPSSGVVGSTSISDVATLTDGYSPSGTVDFNLYGPGDSTCSRAVIYPSSGTVSNGTATSGSYTPTAPGTYYWDASYLGDGSNSPVSSGCGEAVTIGRAVPAIASSPSTGGTVGTGISDTATVGGGFNPTGTVSFALYGPGDTSCTTNLVVGMPGFQNLALSGGGASSPYFSSTAVGTYQWIATYSGDINNTPVSGACGDPSAQVQITAAPPTPTPSPTLQPGFPNTGGSGPGAPPLPLLALPLLLGGVLLSLVMRRRWSVGRRRSS